MQGIIEFPNSEFIHLSNKFNCFKIAIPVFANTSNYIFFKQL
jgi:hypothetical protein